MKESLLRIVAAVLLGLVLPGAVIQLSKVKEPVPAGEQIPTTTGITDTENVQMNGIWVLTDEGNTQWMNLEEYLPGVILAEMSTSFDHQALCAQAVVARTYALKRQLEARHPQGAVCTDPGCCQAYIAESDYLSGLGYKEDVVVTRAAVDATQNMVLTYEDELIEATYFHCAGGQTEDAVAVWGVDYPYLQAVESPGEEEMDHYTDQVFYTRTELESLLGRTLPGSPGSWVGWTSYTTGGGVNTMVFAGIQYSGTRLRSLLKLNSTAFSMEAYGDGLRITTQGKGHRVGMSQNGAQAMALQGSTWQEILAHYYPGTRIDKIEDVGYNTSKIPKE